MDKDFLTIGEMSKISGFPVSKLRYYHDIGLLKANYVDKLTNYRYYSPDQLYSINFISAWKELGFSIEEINRIKNSGGLDNILKLYKERSIEIDKQISELKYKSKGIKDKISLLEEVELSSLRDNRNIEVLKTDGSQVISLIQKGPGAISYQTFLKSKKKILELANKNSLRVKGLSSFSATFLNYPESPLDKSDVEYTIPLLTKTRKRFQFIKEEPSGLWAKNIYRGSFTDSEKITNHIKYLLERVRELGHQNSKGIRCTFRLHSWITTDKEEQITEFLIPIISN